MTELADDVQAIATELVSNAITATVKAGAEHPVMLTLRDRPPELRQASSHCLSATTRAGTREGSNAEPTAAARLIVFRELRQMCLLKLSPWFAVRSKVHTS